MTRRYKVTVRETAAYEIFVTARSEDAAVDAAEDIYADEGPETSLHRDVIHQEFTAEVIRKPAKRA